MSASGQQVLKDFFRKFMQVNTRSKTGGGAPLEGMKNGFTPGEFVRFLLAAKPDHFRSTADVLHAESGLTNRPH